MSASKPYGASNRGSPGGNGRRRWGGHDDRRRVREGQRPWPPPSSRRAGTGARGGPYRGDDRRATGAAGPARPGRQLAVAAAGLLAVWAIMAGGLAWPVVSLPVDGLLLGLQLDVAGAVLAVAAALLCLRWWRLAGDATALRLGVAVLLLGVVTIGTHSLVRLLAEPLAGGQTLAWLSPASRLAALVLLWRAASAPQVDAGLRLGRVVAVAAGVTVAAVAVLTVLPGLARGVASLGDPMLPVEATAVGSAALAGAWLLLAGAHARRGWRDRHWLRSWLALGLLALALAEALLLVAAAGLPAAGAAPGALQAGPALPVAAPALLRACAMLCVLAGAAAALASGFTEQRGRLFEEITSGMTAEARMRAEQLLAQERAHEARNALTAIEGASRTLEVYRDRLDPATQAELSRAITAEIARLQRLVSPDEAPSEPGAFLVADALASVVVGARARGTRIEADLPDDLVAAGRPGQVAEVVQNLVENARRYAPGSPVAVRAQPHRDGVLVRVEDRGPGVPASEREAIFGRGYRGAHAAETPGTGLGLYICARLMREQGGELRVDERVGGGASFALWLPAPPPGALAPPPGAPAPVAGEGAVAELAEGSNIYPLFGALAGGRPAPPQAEPPARGAGDDTGS